MRFFYQNDMRMSFFVTQIASLHCLIECSKNKAHNQRLFITILNALQLQNNFTIQQILKIYGTLRVQHQALGANHQTLQACTDRAYIIMLQPLIKALFLYDSINIFQQIVHCRESKNTLSERICKFAVCISRNIPAVILIAFVQNCFYQLRNCCFHIKCCFNAGLYHIYMRGDILMR